MEAGAPLVLFGLSIGLVIAPKAADTLKLVLWCCVLRVWLTLPAPCASLGTQSLQRVPQGISVPATALSTLQPHNRLPRVPESLLSPSWPPRMPWACEEINNCVCMGSSLLCNE